jgi:hypothetical protein
MPTAVVVMQSGQIGLPQFEHDTPVSREGGGSRWPSAPNLAAAHPGQITLWWP